MKSHLLFCFLILSLFHLQGHVPAISRWVVINGCSLKVEGSTNINRFTCVIADYSKPDTIIINRSAEKAIQMRGRIALPIQHFNCGNPIMTADLRKTLKAKMYPDLVINFLSMSRYPDPRTNPEQVTGVVAIELAGVSRQFEVDYKVVTAVERYINLVGTRVVKFSDFGLTPPRKLGGMIKTNDELRVVFNLRMMILD